MILRIKQSLLDRVQITKETEKPKNVQELENYLLKNSEFSYNFSYIVVIDIDIDIVIIHIKCGK